MSRFVRSKLLSPYNKGVLINGRDRLSVKHSLTHTLILGKSGIGKTSVFFQSNVLRAGTRSFVVSDLDGNMFNKSSGFLQKQGYTVLTLDLKNTLKSGFYNPFPIRINYTP